MPSKALSDAEKALERATTRATAAYEKYLPLLAEQHAAALAVAQVRLAELNLAGHSAPVSPDDIIQLLTGARVDVTKNPTPPVADPTHAPGSVRVEGNKISGGSASITVPSTGHAIPAQPRVEGSDGQAMSREEADALAEQARERIPAEQQPAWLAETEPAKPKRRSIGSRRVAPSTAAVEGTEQAPEQVVAAEQAAAAPLTSSSNAPAFEPTPPVLDDPFAGI